MQDNVILKAVGDLVLGDHPVCFGHGVRSKIDSHGFEYISQGIPELISGADIVFGNLEVPLSGSCYDKFNLKMGELRGEKWYAAKLYELGFNVLSVANNHTMQHGRVSFAETISALREREIKPVGLLEDRKQGKFSLIRKKNIELAFLAYSLRPEKYYPGEPGYCIGELSAIIEDIKNLVNRTRKIVVSLHWGEEYIHYPSTWQIEFAHALIDSGVNIVLGHHPHVLQGIEHYNNGIIAYSLGNFIADKWQRKHRESIVLECHLDQGGIRYCRTIPVLITRECQPLKATLDDAEQILRNLGNYSDFIKKREDTRWSNNDYQRMAEREYLRFRFSSYAYFIKNIFKYNPAIIIQSFGRSVMRKIGYTS